MLHYSKAIAISIALMVVFILPACKKCKESTSSYTRSVTLIDSDISSTYFGENVAAFNVNITQKEHANNECDDKSGIAYLDIANLTNQTISFNYVLNFTGAGNDWNTSGTISIPPNDTVSKGVVSSLNIDYSLGNFAYTASGITYQ